MNRCHGLVFSVVRRINEQLVLNEMGTSYPLPLRLIPACRLMCGSGSALPTSCFLLTRGSAPRAEPKIQVDTCRRGGATAAHQAASRRQAPLFNRFKAA